MLSLVYYIQKEGNKNHVFSFSEHSCNSYNGNLHYKENLPVQNRDSHPHSSRKKFKGSTRMLSF